MDGERGSGSACSRPVPVRKLHGVIMITGIRVIVAGVFMMFGVRTVLFVRNPYLFSDMN